MQIHFNTAFENMSAEEVEKWISFNKNQLIGSAVFTLNNSLTSKIVRWAESWRCKEKDFIPSHTGSIIEKDGMIYLFDMKPPRAAIQPLANYICNTKDTFVLVMRNFQIDTRMFSLNIAYHIGEFYPYLSAIRSVFTKRQTKWVRHCSELHLRELQKQGILTKLNPEITPDELYHALIEEEKK
jgi:hypothetical protein